VGVVGQIFGKVVGHFSGIVLGDKSLRVVNRAVVLPALSLVGPRTAGTSGHFKFSLATHGVAIANGLEQFRGQKTF
jgi:hypothetical protein